MSDVVVDSEFDTLLENLRQKLEPSLLAVGPSEALETAARLVQQQPDYSHRVYVVTDLRTADWESPAEIKQTLQQIQQAGGELQIVGCDRGNPSNLAVLSVEPDSGARAAGVPLFVNIRVKNFGAVPVKRVQLTAVVATYPATGNASEPGAVKPIEQAETIEIEQIGPGETVTRRVQAFFANAGQHAVRAELPADATPADNVRSAIIDIQASEQLLIIDGDPNRRNAFFLDAIFRPGGRAETGVTPVEQSVDFLRNATEDSLRPYAGIFLCDVPTLDERAIANLEAYVRQGGGVAFFMGEQVSLDFYRERLHRGGEGLFPVPLARDAMLLPPGSPDTPNVDVVEERHPVFRELLLGRNPVIRLVKVDRYLQPADQWQAKNDPDARVIARLYNGDPLFVEKRLGRGRVVAVLTTYAPVWNDMVLGPNVLVTLKLQAYLAETRGQHEERLVGQPLDVQLNAQKDLAEVRFVTPGRQADAPRVIERSRQTRTQQPSHGRRARGSRIVRG